MVKLNTDCLVLIFNHLSSKNSLYSCLLVNRDCCHLVVPILWKYPWYNEQESERKLLNTIISCLPPSSKQLLIENDIELSIPSYSEPLFDYISFCEFPTNDVIDNFIEIMLGQEYSKEILSFFNEDINKFQKVVKRNLLEQELYKLFIHQCKNVGDFLFWENVQPLSVFPGAKTCFAKLNYLIIDLSFVTSTALYGMAQICKNIEYLSIKNCQDIPGLLGFVDVQKNLKSVIIQSDMKGFCNEFSKLLTKKANTINELVLDPFDSLAPSILPLMINLQILKLYNYEGNYDTEEFQQYLAISEFPNLENLYVRKLTCLEEFSMLIEKTKGNILEIDISSIDKDVDNTGMFIKSISKYCPKIKKLSTYLELKDIHVVKSLLLNCSHLEYLRFDNLNMLNDENSNFGDEMLDILVKLSSKSLKNIRFNNNWIFSVEAFENFFENWRGRIPLDFFVFYHNATFITKTHILIIQKFINEGVIENSNISYLQ